MDAYQLRVAAFATALVIAGARGSMAQTTESFHACYVPEVGALYVIKLDRLPGDCLAESHVEITWTEGGAGALRRAVTGRHSWSNSVMASSRGPVILSK